MKLSAQEKENLTTLANSVLRGIEEGLSEEIIAERYGVMQSGIADYGSDCLKISDLYDQPELRGDGAGLILLLNYGATYRGPIPADLPEGRNVIHKKLGAGVVTINKTIESSAPGTSCWGHKDDIRMILVDFNGTVTWMNPSETYLAIIPPAEESCTI